ncbi:autotransporter domain-containing protein [Sphingomonas psychrotolerans]|uniref:autotransporter domain-containing protein n=1 Tax=Sphingomonas psychrotolerans TaxID=1327635 RepID=UPI001F285E5C|nr:autotransporter domain-containing protein [Sphingomonas psychrotolerans]
MTIQNGGNVANQNGTLGSQPGSVGTAHVAGAGSTWTHAGNLVVGHHAAGTLVVSSGGMVASTSGIVGRFDDSIGMITVTGAGSAWTNSADLTVGGDGPGTLTIANGGSVSAGGMVTLAANVGSSGDLNIGGSVGAAATGAGALGAANVHFGAGAGRINFNHTGANFAFSAAMSGAGTLNHLAGATHLTGDSSGYTGPTHVLGGTLLVDGKLGGGAVDVQTGGTLSGIGMIGGTVTIASGGTLSGLQGQMLTVQNLDLAGGVNVDVTLSTPGGAALFHITNDLTLDGTLNITSGGIFGPGIYSLMTYGGALTDNGLDVGTTPSGTTTNDFAVQTAVAGQVNLISTALPNLGFWDGDAAGSADNNAIDGGSGVWSATSTNWTDFNGTINGVMHPQPGFVIFQGLAGTVTADASAGVIAVTGMQFASDGYQINGAPITLADANSIIRVGDGSAAGANFTATIGSVLTGTGGLNKTDLGTLILTADNDYAGGTTITGGTLQLGNGGTSGSVTGDIVDNGTLIFNRSDLTTFAGAISGAGTIRQSGTGTTNLTGNSGAFTGMITVNGGGLGIMSGGALNAGSFYAALDAGSTGAVAVDGVGSSLTSTGPLVIGAGGAGTLTVGNGATVSDNQAFVGYLAGSSGTATVDGAGSIWATTNDLTIGSAGSGTLNIANGGSVTSASGNLGAAAGAQGTVTVSGAGSSWINSGEIGIGGSGTGVLTIGNGGKVRSDFGSLGVNVGAIGTAAVNGAGSIWTNTDDLIVGARGTGTLTIANGGAASNIDGVLGHDPGASGSVTVDGVGSTWTNSGNVFVGGSGVGTLNIVNGGAVSGVIGNLGFGAGSIGTATVDGVGSTWTNTGNLNVGADGSGTLTIANDGAVSAGEAFVVAGNAGSTGVLNIGAAAGSPAAGAGALNAANLQFGNGSGVVNFNHNATNYLFATNMAGAGTINQLAGNTNLTGSSNGFVGAVNVKGGRLAVNGSLAGGQVTVSNGATLGGNGVIGSLTAQSGSIIAPGNSIGTLNVAGNASFASGSTYQVELTSTGLSDLINVAGATSIANGARLSVVKTDAAPYVLGTHYTVLKAAGGVTGSYTFDNLQLTNFIGLVAGADASSVYLDVAKTKTFGSAGATPNETATGQGLDSLPLTSVLVGAVANLPTDAAAQGAFNQLSGEIHASMASGMVEDGRIVRESMLDRLRGSIDSLPATADGRVSVWGRGFGSRGRLGGDGNAASIKHDDSGFLMGVDGMVGSDWRIGFVGGYSHSTVQDAARASSGKSDNYHVGVYGGAQLGKLGLRSGLAYTLHDVTTTRAVAFAGISDALRGEYQARTTQAFGEIAYALPMGKASLEPFANLAYVDHGAGGFAEKGGAAALSGKGGQANVTFSTAGLRGVSQFELGGGALVKARGAIGWRHAFGDVAPEATMAFMGGSSFDIGGAPIVREGAVIDLGADVELSDKTNLGLSYGGQFGSGSSSNSLRATLAVKF